MRSTGFGLFGPGLFGSGLFGSGLFGPGLFGRDLFGRDLFGPGLSGRCFTAFGPVALLGACATSERAEAIFLQQHRATTALTETIVAAEAEDPELAERLYGTESELDDACAPLRQAGYRKLYGGAVDGELQWAILDTLDGCAAKTQEVEILLWRVDPGTAKYFLGGANTASAASEN